LYTGDLESCVDILTANRNPTKGTNVFCSHLIQNEVTLTRTSIVMQFKSQMAFTNLEKTYMVLIYDEACGHSELARQIYGERFLQKILPNARTKTIVYT
jgi:hypothetical protein